MHPAFATRGSAASIPIWFVTAATWRDISAGLDQNACAFAKAAGFEPLPGRHVLLPGPDGALAAVLFGLEEEGKPFNPFLPGTLAGLLPRGVYRFANAAHDQRLAALAVALGAYRFIRYGKPANEVRLELPEQTNGTDLSRIVEAVYLARDLINTPTNDMGPGELAEAVAALAARHGASFGVTVGDDLLAQNFPLIHAVGRAAVRPPRLIDLTWGDPAAPKVTLVGKGVCFDSGGLDIKSDTAMLLMKKDMGAPRVCSLSPT
jgi:leucyl aminopeptidase